jgi:hypothetical protein
MWVKKEIKVFNSPHFPIKRRYHPKIVQPFIIYLFLSESNVYIIQGIPSQPIDADEGFSSGISLITTSVVNIIPAIDPAF